MSQDTSSRIRFAFSEYKSALLPAFEHSFRVYGSKSSSSRMASSHMFSDHHAEEGSAGVDIYVINYI